MNKELNDLLRNINTLETKIIRLDESIAIYSLEKPVRDSERWMSCSVPVWDEYRHSMKVDLAKGDYKWSAKSN